MRFLILLFVFIGLSCFLNSALKAATVPPKIVSNQPSDISSLKNIYDISFGNPQAPIKIVMYFSPTCTHCSEYEEKILPEIQKKYIETGKVYFVMRILPFHSLDFAVAKFIRSQGQTEVHKLAQLFLSHQHEWLEPVTREKKDWPKLLKKKLKEASKQLDVSVKVLRDKLELNDKADDAFLKIFAVINGFKIEEIHQILKENAVLEEALSANHLQAEEDFGKHLDYVPAFWVNGEPQKNWVKPDVIEEKLKALS